MAFPADRFAAQPTEEQLPLRLPPLLSSTIPAPRRPLPTPAPTPPPSVGHTVAPAVPVAVGDSVRLAVEVARVIPASGNLAVCGQQFWLGPAHAGRTITLWADTTVIHLLLNGARLKSVPSRLTLDHLRQLLAEDGQPAGPSPIAAGPAESGGPIEVDRIVTANGLIALAGRQHPIGYHLAGRRITARLDYGVLQILDTGRTLLRSLPNPLTKADLARLRDARPAGPPPAPARDAQRVERRVSSRGSLVIAGQRIHPGIAHAGRIVTVEATDATFRVYDGDQLLIEVACTTTKPIARFKARKPEPPRQTTIGKRGGQ
ncbi:hypothetical protein [Micromonospora sp. NPDC005206]|uniref:hypothetical protein n=1 Tax=Micromonospora sp. NPDC005206 TaxID=3157022 RepID=UPI0033A803F9